MKKQKKSCPHCQSEVWVEAASRRTYRCSSCGRTFTFTPGAAPAAGKPPGQPLVKGGLQDLLGAQLSKVRPSPSPAFGTVLQSRGPKLSYKDIGGLGREVSRIREMIELPLLSPEVFQRLGIEPPKGVLLHGPPGCGKTLIARAVAHETSAHFIQVNGPEIMHKYYGESEAHLRGVFQDAQAHAPNIIFLDEIDAIAPKREGLDSEKQVERRVVAQLLILMDGLESRGKVIVIAATNIPNTLEPALRRPGRFDREIAIQAPDKDGRREVIEIYARGMPLATDVDLDELAAKTHGFVGGRPRVPLPGSSHERPTGGHA